MKKQTIPVALVLLVLLTLFGIARTQKQVNSEATFPISDSFTGLNGTQLENHLTNSGHSYIRPPWSSNGTISIWNNWALHGTVGFRSTYLANVQLPKNQFVQIDINFRGDWVRPELKARANPSTENLLQLGYDIESQNWFLEANEGYSSSSFQEKTAMAFSNIDGMVKQGNQKALIYPMGTFHDPIGSAHVKRILRVEAHGNVIKLYVDGILRISADLPEEVEYNLNGPGFVGFSLAGRSTASGTFLDNFEAGSLDFPSPSPSPSPTQNPSPSPSPSSSPCTWRFLIDTATEKHIVCN